MNYLFTKLFVSYLTEMLLKRNIGNRDKVYNIGTHNPVVKVRLAMLTLDKGFYSKDEYYDIHHEKHKESQHGSHMN